MEELLLNSFINMSTRKSVSRVDFVLIRLIQFDDNGKDCKNVPHGSNAKNLTRYSKSTPRKSKWF